jgi:hypothetical protein
MHTLSTRSPAEKKLPRRGTVLSRVYRAQQEAAGSDAEEGEKAKHTMVVLPGMTFGAAALQRRTVWDCSLVVQVRFCRYRFCPTGELKYRGAVG